jgi:hypothetical protein
MRWPTELVGGNEVGGIAGGGTGAMGVTRALGGVSGEPL